MYLKYLTRRTQRLIISKTNCKIIIKRNLRIKSKYFLNMLFENQLKIFDSEKNSYYHDKNNFNKSKLVI